MKTRKIVLSGLFLALGLLLPFVTGQVPEIGNMLLPMHIPVLICGYVCGWHWGLVIGFITPLLRSVMFGMPMMVPKAICMAFELMAYGMMSGLVYQRMRHKRWKIYISLLTAMVSGRIVWGIVAALVYGLLGIAFGVEIFVAEALINALPGIILQLLLIPGLIYTLEKAGIVEK